MKYQVLNHSSIKFYCDDKVIYFDPFEIKENTQDADIIFITHNHFDHYSKKDIEKIIKKDTTIVLPISAEKRNYKNVIYVKPKDKIFVSDIFVEVIPSYNKKLNYHKKSDNFVGYILTINDERYYIMGDCDLNKDNKKIKVDYLFIPIGGTYTFNPTEAAAYVNKTKPRVAIATHYNFYDEDSDPVEIFKGLVNKEIIVQR